MSLKTDIQSYFTETIDSELTNFKTWLLNGFRDVTGKLRSDQREMLKEVGSTSLGGDIFIYATRTNIVCRIIPSSDFIYAEEPYSRLYATTYDPVCNIEDNTVSILPTAGTEKVFVIKLPTISADLSDTSLANFDDFLKSLVVLYAVVQGKRHLARALSDNIGTISSDIRDDIDSLLSNELTGIVVSPPDEIVLDTSTVEGIDDFIDIPRPTYRAIDDFDDSTLFDNLTNETWSETLTLDDTPPSMSIASELDETIFDIFDNVVSSDLTTHLDSLDTSDIALPVLEPVSPPELLDIESYTAPIADDFPTAPSLDDSLQTSLEFNWDTYDLATQEYDFTNFDTHMTNEDIELANGESSKQRDLIQKYLGELNSSVSKTQSNIQKLSSEKKLEIDRILRYNSDKITEYKTKTDSVISKYRADIEGATTSFSQETQARLRYNDNLIAEFSANISANVSSYREQVSTYTTNIRTRIEEWSTKSNAYVAKYNGDIELASKNAMSQIDAWKVKNSLNVEQDKLLVQLYVSEMKTKVEVYMARMKEFYEKQQLSNKQIFDEASIRVSVWKSKVDSYTNYNSSLIQQYSVDVKKEISKVEVELKRYSTELNVLISEFQANIQYKLGLYKADVDYASSLIQSQLGIYKNKIELLASKLSTLQVDLNRVKLLYDEANTLYKEYDKELKEYIGYPVQNDRRRE